MDNYIPLSYWDLAAASVLVFINAGLSVIFRLRVHRSLLIAAIRMVVQLSLVGVVLTTLFSVVSVRRFDAKVEWTAFSFTTLGCSYLRTYQCIRQVFEKFDDLVIGKCLRQQNQAENE